MAQIPLLPLAFRNSKSGIQNFAESTVSNATRTQFTFNQNSLTVFYLNQIVSGRTNAAFYAQPLGTQPTNSRFVFGVEFTNVAPADRSSIGLGLSSVFGRTQAVGAESDTFGVRLDGNIFKFGQTVGTPQSSHPTPSADTSNFHIYLIVDYERMLIWTSIGNSSFRWVDGDTARNESNEFILNHINNGVPAGVNTSAVSTIPAGMSGELLPYISLNKTNPAGLNVGVTFDGGNFRSVSSAPDTLPSRMVNGFSSVYADGGTWNITAASNNMRFFRGGYAVGQGQGLVGLPVVSNWLAPTGRYHWEYRLVSGFLDSYMGVYIGLVDNASPPPELGSPITSTDNFVLIQPRASGVRVYRGNTLVSTLPAIPLNTKVIAVELDVDNRRISFFTESSTIVSNLDFPGSGGIYPAYIASATSFGFLNMGRLGNTTFQAPVSVGYQGPDTRDLSPNASSPLINIPVTFTATAKLLIHAVVNEINIRIGIETNRIPIKIHATTTVDIKLTTDSTVTVRPVLHANLTFPRFTNTGMLLEAQVFSSEGVEDTPLLLAEATMVSPHIAVGVSELPLFESVGTFGVSIVSRLPIVYSEGILNVGRVASSFFGMAIPMTLSEGLLTNQRLARVDIDLPLLVSRGRLNIGQMFYAESSLRALENKDSLLLVGTISGASNAIPLLKTTGVVLSERFYRTVDLASDSLLFYTEGFIANSSANASTCWVMNTENTAVTNYQGYNFLAVGRYNGAYYGIKADGLYRLDSDTDNGAPIPARFLSGLEDFDSEHMKRMDYSYVGLSSSGGMSLLVNTDDGATTRTYPVKRLSGSSKTRSGRIQLGKGIRSRYWQVGLSNMEGADFEVDSLGMLARVLNRKT